MLTIIYPKDPSDVDSHSAPSLLIFVRNQATPSEYSWRIIFPYNFSTTEDINT